MARIPGEQPSCLVLGDATSGEVTEKKSRKNLCIPGWTILQEVQLKPQGVFNDEVELDT